MWIKLSGKSTSPYTLQINSSKYTEFKFALGDLNWDIVCSGMIGLIKGHQGGICSEINSPGRNR